MRIDFNNGSFIEEIKCGKVTKSKIKESVRVYQLNNGDIFQKDNMFYEYNNSLIYEVEACGYNEFMQTNWIRTGKILSIEELNDIREA